MSSKGKTHKPSSTRATKPPSFLDDLAFSFATPEERKKIAEKHRVARREASGESKHGERKHGEKKHGKKERGEKKRRRAETTVRCSHEELAGEGPAVRAVQDWERMSEAERRENRAESGKWNSKVFDGHVSVDDGDMERCVTSAAGEENSEGSRNPFLRWMDEKLFHKEVKKGEAGMIRQWKVAETPYSEWVREQERGENVVEISVSGLRHFASEEGGSRRSKGTESTQTMNSLSPSWPTRGYTPPASESRGYTRSRTQERKSARSSESGRSSRGTKGGYEDDKGMEGQVAHVTETDPRLRYRDPDAIGPQKPKAGSAPSEWFLAGGTSLTEENLKGHTAAGGGQRGFQAKSMGWAAGRAREGEGGEDASDGGSEVSLWEGGGDDDLEPEDSISVRWMKVGYWDRKEW